MAASPAQAGIGRRQYSVPTANSNPTGIAAGPDGALWFTEYNSGKVGRITTWGTFTEFPIPTAQSGPLGIAVGPDGALWFTEQISDKIGRIATGGTFTEFPIPTALSSPQDIAAGPDEALWFTERGGGKIRPDHDDGCVHRISAPHLGERPG
jgi:virginiamycin B lyase